MPAALRIESHRNSWSQDFEAEAGRIRDTLGSALIALHHIGSTAIPGILAKPIIDMLADISSLAAVDECQQQMQELGYESLGEFGIPGRRYFRKADDHGVRTHQLHAFVHDSPDLLRHLAFRDYLRVHPEIAMAYSDLKHRLVETCQGDINAYMDGKDGFVKAVERDALAWRAGLVR